MRRMARRQNKCCDGARLTRMTQDRPGGSTRIRTCEQLGDVRRPASGQLLYLLATAEAIGEKHGLRRCRADHRDHDPFSGCD